MASVLFKNVVAQGGQTAAERFAEMTKDANTFYKVASELYFGSVHLSTETAAEIGIEDLEGVLNASDVEAALNEIFHDQNAKKIWFHDDSSGQSEYAKVYKIYQGENDYVADPAEGYVNPTLIGTINTPLDKVVQSGSVVEIFFDSTDNTLHEDSISGADVTTFIKGSTTPTEADAGKYIKLVLQNVSDPLYIAVKDLTDVYTGGTNTEATVIIDEHNVVKVEINKVVATKVIYQAGVAAHYEEDDTVTSENWDEKVASGIYVDVDGTYTAVEVGDTFDENTTYYKSIDAVPEVTIKAQVDNVEDKVDALADYVGEIPAGTDPSVDSVIGYVDYKTGSGVGALNGEAGIASKSGDVVTIKGGIVETVGKIANSTATAPATEEDGYLNPADGKFYEEDSYQTEIPGAADTAYKDLSDNKVYVWTGEALVLVREDVVLASVASTGASEDVSYDNTESGLLATDLQAAIDELAQTTEQLSETLTWDDV